MSVQEVNIPPKINTVDATTIKPKKEDDPEYWERQKAKIRHQREFLEEKKALETLENPQTPEPPFQIKGGINLGTIDLQEQQRRAQEEMEKSREEAAARERELAEKLEAANRELAETKMSAALKEIGSQFTNVIKEMDSKIDSIAKGSSDPSTLINYINTLEQLAGKMGLQRAEAMPGVGDPRLAIELQRLKAEEAQRERQFQLDMEKFRYEIQRQLKNDDAERELRKEEINAKRERDKMLSALPETIGKAIAKGMMEETPIQAQPQPAVQSKAPPVTTAKSKPKEAYSITAKISEFGEFECPDCGQRVALAPEVPEAICASCGLKVPIERVND